MIEIDHTNSPDLRSWVESANQPDIDFPIQNLPFGCFALDGRQSIGVAIGQEILDLNCVAASGLSDSLAPELQEALAAPNLNPLMALERRHWKSLRRWISDALSEFAAASTQDSLRSCLVAQADVEMLLPATVGDYTDFYASVFHATNVGSLFRPDNPLLPNYKYIPIGYHGRTSTLIPSGKTVRRPLGQRKGPQEETPSYGPCRLLDYEMEVGLWVGGPPNELGTVVPIDQAEDRLFGVCLLNDWSARDIQAWEYQPLGPFLAKSFATSLSPWIVTLEALAPFRCPEYQRPDGDPAPLPYLASTEVNGGFDFEVQVFLSSAAMRQQGDGISHEHQLSATSAANLYWTPAQMLTHHASNGCVMNPGDLFGTGTISGPTKQELGSLLEITRRGQEPINLADGSTRRMLEDGDEVIFRGSAVREGSQRIGFGECRGVVLPAIGE